MANKRQRCKNCGQHGDVNDMIRRGLTYFCSVESSIQYTIALANKSRDRLAKKATKEVKKKHAKQKREFYANDVRTRKNAAKKACHDFIRYRDRNNGCICCNRHLGKNYDAGHWLESGNNSFLRYHEDNIHAQSVHCNQYKGGDSGDYERNLRAKIGGERVDYLLANKGGVVKRKASDYKCIEDNYKEKLKELKLLT